MHYKLIAIDCDRTLLDSTGHIPEINKRVIGLVREKGAEVVIATGRNDILAKDYAEELGLDNTMISCNGAVLSNVIKNEVYSVHALDKKALDIYIDCCRRMNVLFKVLSVNACYTNDEQAMKLGLMQITKGYTKELKYKLPYHFVEDMTILRGREDIVKAVVIEDDPDRRAAIYAQLKDLPHVNVYYAGFNCIDAISENASKGLALETLAKMRGVAREDIIAFGDGENDASMIKYAGLGIAMQNGDEQLKAAADMVTEFTADDGGVGRTLAKLFETELKGE